MVESGSALDGVIIQGNPLVSVCVITYNHGKYIKKCLDSILMQEVNFPYEILIHDDASPDNTAEIIQEYEFKYPKIIKPICQTLNQYSQGIDVSQFNFDRAKGKYIAQCEGDDYWTDPNKLQMQVDFLEMNNEYVETGHNITVLGEQGIIQNHLESTRPEREYSIDDLKKGNLWRIATASAVYRNIFPSVDKNILDSYYACKANGDMKISFLLSQHGKCYVFKRQMSVYRYITSHGTSYNARHRDENMGLFRYDSCMQITQFMKSSYNIDIEFKNYFRDNIYESLLFLVRNIHKGLIKQNTNILGYLLHDYLMRYGMMASLFVVLIYTPMKIISRLLSRYLSIY